MVNSFMLSMYMLKPNADTGIKYVDNFSVIENICHGRGESDFYFFIFILVFS